MTCINFKVCRKAIALALVRINFPLDLDFWPEHIPLRLF